MARADRLERLEARRLHAEAEYRATLLDALRATAAGQWGLFGHNEWQGRSYRPPAVLADLCELGEAIDEMRVSLSLEPFGLHHEFLAARGRRQSSSEVGEPRQAQAWLDRLMQGGAGQKERAPRQSPERPLNFLLPDQPRLALIIA
jgi:hypothetical protein